MIVNFPLLKQVIVDKGDLVSPFSSLPMETPSQEARSEGHFHPNRGSSLFTANRDRAAPSLPSLRLLLSIYTALRDDGRNPTIYSFNGF